ncbi:lipopolysaccharide heptosyltransferase II [Neisseriaceae bacterium TC5R-5]|nr:lipopolysaccharide heptosyltransferase II [Neisseriaceae bacterium TC5R-5]
MKKKILVIGPSWVGDSIMAQPLYRRLHQRHTELELHVFSPQWTLPLLARMPEVAQTHLNPFGHGALRLLERWKVARQLRQQGFDQAIVLPNSLKSALIPFMAGIPVRTGFVGESRYGLLNDARQLDELALPLMVERFSALAEDKNKTPTSATEYPQLSINRRSQLETMARLQLKIDQPVIAFCPGAEYGPAKRWPARHFAQLAQRFAQAGYAIWIFGSEKDQEIGKQIQQLAHGVCHNLCGATGLAEAIDLLALTQLVICNDSGLMHVAAALNKPLLALYGSSSPDFTPPLSDTATIVSLNLDCSPCFERVCPYQHTHCLENMQPDSVWQAAQDFLTPLTT